MSPDGPARPAVDRSYRCGAGARWLPRALGGAVLFVATLMALRIDATIVRVLPFARPIVVVTGALIALVVVRRGAEVRSVYRLTPEEIVVGDPERGSRLRYADVERLDWAPPFSGSLAWIPAAVLVDREGRSWRVPGLIHEGDAMIRELLSRAGRHDLDAWSEAYRLERRMGRHRARVRAGYGIALALLFAAAVHWAL